MKTHTLRPSTRPANFTDLAAIVHLLRRDTEALGCLPTPAIRQRIRAGHVHVATVGAEVVGYLVTYSPRRPGKTADHVHHICVRADLRRRGIATLLLRGAAAAARQIGRTWILAWCRASLPANSFWRATGAIPTHIRPGGEKRRVPIVLWQLPIAPPKAPANLVPVEPHRAGARSANRSDIRHISARELLAWNLIIPGKLDAERPSARRAVRPPGAKVAERARPVAAAGGGRPRSTVGRRA